jgi:hypothetical protein
MYNIYLLQEDDIVVPGLYCRNLYCTQTFDDGWREIPGFSIPSNSYKWVPVEEMFGPKLYNSGKTVKEIVGDFGPMEFIKGDLPESHIWVREN